MPSYYACLFETDVVENDKPKWWNNDKTEFERIRRETKKLIRKSKRNLEICISNSSKANPRSFYNYVREKKILSNNIGPLSMENGQHTDNTNEIDNVLKDSFTQPPIPAQDDENFIDSLIFKESDILHKINKLKVNKNVWT